MATNSRLGEFCRRLVNINHKTCQLKFIDRRTHLNLSQLTTRASFSSSCAKWQNVNNDQSTRFPVPDKSTLDPDIREKLEEVERKSGFLPNVFKVLSHRPDEFRAFFRYYDALMEKETGSLSKADKEMIVIATSSANDCLYCVVAHSALHRLFSRNTILADQIATNWKCSNLGERDKAILEFAMDVCHARPITDQHFVKLEQHGLSKEDGWDIGAIAAFFALSNRMAHVTGMLPNNEFYLLGRVKKDLYEKAMETK